MKNKGLLSVGALVMALSMILTGCGGGDNTSGTTTASTTETPQSSGTNIGLSSDLSGMPEIVDISRYTHVPVLPFVDKEYKPGDLFNQATYGEYYYNAIENGKDISGNPTLRVGVSEFLKGMKFDNFYGDKTLSSIPYQVKILKAYNFKSESDDSSTQGASQFRAMLNENYDADTATYLYNLYTGVSAFTGKYCAEGDTSREELKGFCYVDGGKLIVFFGEEPTFNPAEGTIIEYEISAKDGNLTFSRNGATAPLILKDFSDISLQTKGELGNKLQVLGYASGKNQLYKDIESFYYYEESSSPSVRFTDEGYATEVTAEVSDDRREITFTWEDERRPNEKGVLQPNGQSGSFTFRIHNLGGYEPLLNTGCIIEDGGRYYVYGLDQREYQYMKLLPSMEAAGITELPDTTARELLLAQGSLLRALASRFNEAGINATVDNMTNNIYLDANVLFDVDSAEINAVGRDLLGKFMDVYSSVIEDEDFKDSISSLLIEGHTDTNGSYEHNQDLSEKRAAAVSSYALELHPQLKGTLVEKGCSYDNPIYNEDGTINMDASRRVAFSFVMKLN